MCLTSFASPSMGHWATSPWTAKNNFQFTSEPHKLCDSYLQVPYFLSLGKRVKSTTRGVLSRLENTKMIFGRGSAPDSAGGIRLGPSSFFTQSTPVRAPPSYQILATPLFKIHQIVFCDDLAYELDYTRIQTDRQTQPST